uniref:Uncharacterized protein n=1 Tax=Opuntia streptacantha TaxID=393608 RepID=A0A7C9A5Q6_OPUST
MIAVGAYIGPSHWPIGLVWVGMLGSISQQLTWRKSTRKGGSPLIKRGHPQQYEEVRSEKRPSSEFQVGCFVLPKGCIMCDGRNSTQEVLQRLSYILFCM